VHFIGVHLAGVHLVSVHLMSVHLTSVCLTGMHLIGMHPVGVIPLAGILHNRQLSERCRSLTYMPLPLIVYHSDKLSVCVPRYIPGDCDSCLTLES
jgi:hypothetical protein